MGLRSRPHVVFLEQGQHSGQIHVGHGGCAPHHVQVRVCLRKGRVCGEKGGRGSKAERVGVAWWETADVWGLYAITTHRSELALVGKQRGKSKKNNAQEGMF